jgi:hypothetical protein
MHKFVLNMVGLSVVNLVVAGLFLAGGPLIPRIASFSVEAAAAAAKTQKAGTGVRVPTGDCFWSEFDWDDLRPSEQNAWAVLGWNRQRWNSVSISSAPASESKDWDELTRGERGALTDLGFTQETWDVGADC